MNWRKRTDDEIKKSTSEKDYTEGYEFLPWLFWKKKMYVVGFFGNMALGIFGGVSTIIGNDNPIWYGFAIITFFVIFTPTLIMSFLVREHRDKKGISR